VEGRPGASLPDYDFEKGRAELAKPYGENQITEKDLLSFALYPQVYVDWKEFEAIYGEVASLPTHLFLNPMKPGDEVDLELASGNSKIVKLVSIQDAQVDGTRKVTFEVNGEPWVFLVTDHSQESAGAVREKAGAPGTIGAPMPGVIVSLKVKEGDIIKEGDAVATLSAMKMETSIPATSSGVVKRVVVNVGDKVDGDDLLMEID
jgi:pyruvate carboxylase